MVVGRRASVLARLSDAQRVLHPGSLGLALVAVTLVSASSAASPRLVDATVGVRAVLSSRFVERSLASGPWGAPRIAVDAWLNSPPHRETLFGRAWREQGFAVVSRCSVTDARCSSRAR